MQIMIIHEFRNTGGYPGTDFVLFIVCFDPGTRFVLIIVCFRVQLVSLVLFSLTPYVLFGTWYGS